jgi:acyl-CoA synthetase (AMP-forming)/AMP-acid ligase II
VGLPLPGVELEVRDGQGRPQPEGRVGRIFVKGPGVMDRYWGNPEATAGVLREGWLDTGDLGFALGGELHVCGRAKDVVIIRGANHSPQEFEECLDGVAGLRAGCAIALGLVPEGGEEEGLLILAEAAEPSPALIEVIRSAVVERTGIRPQRIELLVPGTLPRTSSGKMRRQEALRQFLAGELKAPAPVTPLRMAVQVARSQVAYARAKLARG